MLWIGARRLAVLLAGFLLGSTVVSAWALSQNGQESNSNNVYGSDITIIGESFYAPSGRCVIYAHLITKWSPGRHVEAGQLRCDGATADGTCHNDHLVVERFNGTSYYCAQGVTFNNGQGALSTIRRSPSLTSTSMRGVVAGAEMTQSGFTIGVDTVATAWGETTPSGCPTGPARGRFVSWEKLGSGGVWRTMTGSPFRNGTNCWGTISPIVNGGFYVQR